MFEFLKSKRPQTETPPSGAPLSVAPNSTQQHRNIHRELIRVVLKDTLRLHGIPSAWMACEVIVITRLPKEEELHIQLVVLKWNEKLLRYATALQRQLLLGLDRFDPTVDHSKYVVSWRFAPDCGSPFLSMPDPKFWSAPAATSQTQPDKEPVSILDRRQSRRAPNAPQARSLPVPPPDDESDFSQTQITPLR